MTDGPERSAISRRQGETGAVTSLASRALSVLVTRRVPRDTRRVEALIDRLEAAVLDRNPEGRPMVLDEMRAQQITDVQIVDELIPEVARRLGVAWCEDNMGFAEVTIGSARLQAMVRDLTVETDAATAASAPLVAVIVPEGEHHSLGAIVLTAQLRRSGYAVRLLLGRSESQVAEQLAGDRFDAVFLSAAHGERLEKLGSFVKKIRQAVTRATPIVVGGSAIARGSTIGGNIGADYVTSDINEALNACGLKTFHEEERRHGTTREMTSPGS